MMFLVADEKDIVSALLDVAIVGTLPGSNIPVVSALLSVTTTSVPVSS